RFALLFLSSHLAPLALHSFPTRRSSDLLPSAPALMQVIPDTVSGQWRSSADVVHRPARRVSWETCTGRGRSPGVTRVSAVLPGRSEEHTSELQSRENLVCRLLLEKKKTH